MQSKQFHSKVFTPKMKVYKKTFMRLVVAALCIISLPPKNEKSAGVNQKENEYTNVHSYNMILICSTKKATTDRDNMDEYQKDYT